MFHDKDLIGVWVHLSSKSYISEKKIKYHYFKAFNIKSIENNQSYSYCQSSKFISFN